MLLNEIVQLHERIAIQGYWTMQKVNNVIRWHPIFNQPQTPEAVFPFVSKQNAKSSSALVNAVQAFDILPYGKRKDLEESELFGQLEDALKRRSNTSVISDEDFNQLISISASLLIGKTGLHHQNPRRLFIATPPSSSDVAEAFAQHIQQKLGIVDNHSFYGHFGKRDVVSIIDEVEVNTTLSDIDRESIVDRLLTRYKNRVDLTIKVKDLWFGHRKALERAGISLFELVKQIKLPEQNVPVLLIIDDNVQAGSTARSIAKLFVDTTGVQPNHIYSLAMFKYP